MEIIIAFSFLRSKDVVPAPKNLRFSEVTHTSFRAHWEHGAPDVALYRIGWVKKGDTHTQYVRENQMSGVFILGVNHAGIQDESHSRRLALLRKDLRWRQGEHLKNRLWILHGLHLVFIG